MKPVLVCLMLFLLAGCSATQLREHYHTLMGVPQLRAAWERVHLSSERLLKTEQKRWQEERDLMVENTDLTLREETNRIKAQLTQKCRQMIHEASKLTNKERTHIFETLDFDLDARCTPFLGEKFIRQTEEAWRDQHTPWRMDPSFPHRSTSDDQFKIHYFYLYEPGGGFREAGFSLY